MQQLGFGWLTDKHPRLPPRWQREALELKPRPKVSAPWTDFAPGQTIVLKTEAGEPAHYKFSKTVTYQTADGRVIEPSKIRKDSRIRVHYLKSGDDMLVDKVIVIDRD